MNQPSAHPSWCDHPYSPADSTHTHTHTIGVVVIGTDVTLDVVLTQVPEETAPVVTLHITGPRVDLVVATRQGQPWMVAGLMIDATVVLARTAPGLATDDRSASSTTATPPDADSGRLHPAADGPAARRATGRRRVPRVVRCVRQYRPKDGDGPSAGMTGDGQGPQR